MRTKPADDTTEAIVLSCLPLVRPVYDFVLAHTHGPLQATLLCELVRDMFIMTAGDELGPAVVQSRKVIVPLMAKAFADAARLHREDKDGKARTSSAGPRKKDPL